MNSRFVIDRIVLECDGASVAIVAAGRESSDRGQLCLEIVTSDPLRDDPEDTALSLYCPEAAPTVRRWQVRPSPPPSRRRRAVLVTAVAAALALLATVIGLGLRHPPASSAPAAASAPGDPGAASRDHSDPAAATTDGATFSAAADLASRCSHMIDAASSALGIDHTGLVRSLVADHEGQTLNAAVDQELRDARAVLVSRLSRTDASPPPTVADLDALDAAIADVAATPCSSGEEDQVASPAPVVARAR